MMIQRGITITETQAKYIDNTDLQLSKFVQRKIDEKMMEDKSND